MAHLVIKRIYETVQPTDGYRILVDRLWPRGISKEVAQINEWNKDLAPSIELRKWFNHDPVTWKESEEKYLAELKANDIADFIRRTDGKQDKLTLDDAAEDERRSHPLVDCED